MIEAIRLLLLLRRILEQHLRELDETSADRKIRVPFDHSLSLILKVTDVITPRYIRDDRNAYAVRKGLHLILFIRNISSIEDDILLAA